MVSKLTAGCVAEFLGTFALTFFGAGSIILTAYQYGGNPVAPSSGLITVALAHGLILFTFISGCMYISGGQFNPAVSFALVVAGKQPPARAAFFIPAQLVGSVAAAALLQYFLTPEVANSDTARLGATIGQLTDLGRTGAVFGIETVLTFALAFVVLTSAVDDRGHKLGGLPIGMTVTACILAAGPLTGASMNPARTFGPALIGNHWLMPAVYWLAPLTGAFIAGMVYRLFWNTARD